MVELQSPIISIGAGRSGSTLLYRILNAHPDVVFFNENSFLAPRLWLELWQDRFWFSSQMFVARQPRSALDPQPAMEPAVLEQEQQRIGALIVQMIADVHRLDRTSCKVWGYKEIWNGSSQFDYPWEDYDTIFTGAFWLHLTRNPFQFARSTAHWNRDPLTLDYLQERLTDWVAIVEKSTQRTATSRYHQIRYEDLVGNPRSCLTPVLESNGLSWHDDCLQALDRFSMKSAGESPGPDRAAACDRNELIALTREIQGLEKWMEKLDYSIPQDFEAQIEAPRPDHTRPSFAELNMIAETELDGRKHRPQHLLQQTVSDLKQACSDLQQAWSEEVGKLQKEMQCEAAAWQHRWQIEHDNYLRERENFLNERKRHFIFYFFVRRYHELRVLFGKK